MMKVSESLRGEKKFKGKKISITYISITKLLFLTCFKEIFYPCTMYKLAEYCPCKLNSQFSEDS